MKPEDWYTAVKAPTIIIAGAANGRRVKEYRRRWPTAHYVLFEPCTAYRDALLTFADDRLVTVEHKALCSYAGYSDFYEYSSPLTSSLYPANPAHEMARVIGTATQTRVQCTTLDDWCQVHSVGHIGFLELDVQGGELAALRGAWNMLHTQAIDCLMIEVFFTQVYQAIPMAGEVDDYLAGAGYDCLGRLPQHQMDGASGHWGDMVYVRAA